MRFNYAPEIQSTFLFGDCGSLCLEINDLTNWPIYGIYVSCRCKHLNINDLVHYVIMTPNNLYLDIIGLRTYDELILELPIDFETLNAKIDIKLVDRTLSNYDYAYSQLNINLAKNYARDILNKIRM